MAANVNFFRGEDVTLKIYQDGNPVYIAAKNWTVDLNATEIQEGVNGEDRDRLDLVANYYSGSVDIYQADQTLMLALIDAQGTDDAAASPLAQRASVRIRQRDGTRAAYKLSNCRFGPWTMAQTGRADPVMLTMKFRFTNFDEVQVI